jgi:uncharacterized Zn finger protein/superfamily II DNA or RNA helicase
MAARTSFGKTWWGNAWVEAMERIDHNTNRLPRGKRYANGGNVTKINIEGDQIKAKVQGSRRKPYDIVIALRKFTPEQQGMIKSALSENPAIASALALGNLPQEILDLFSNRRLNLLPNSWQDLAANCSCPDWANPCKHLAAVYYIIANEIDKDPFLLFRLRGLQAEELMTAAGFSAQIKAEAEKTPFVPYLNTDFSNLKQELLPAKAVFDLSFLAGENEIATISALLRENPLFYANGNFKNILLKAYKNIANSLTQIEPAENGFSFGSLDFSMIYPLPKAAAASQHLQTKATFFAFPDGENLADIEGKPATVSLPEPCSSKPTLKRRKGKLVPVKAILDIFLALPLETSEHSSFGVRFISAATAVAQALAQSAAFVPEVRDNGAGSFFISYRPLTRLKGVQEAIDYLIKLIPAGFVFCKEDKSILLPKDGVEEVLSIILLYLVERFAGINEDNKLCHAFFRGLYYSALSFEEKQTAKTIADWLACLNLQGAKIAPVISIGLSKKEQEKFMVKIAVENKEDPLAPLLPLSGIFTEEKKIFSFPAEVVRSEVARQIMITAEYFPILRNLLNHKGQKIARIGSRMISDFLNSGRHICSLLGIKVVIPKELKELASPKLALKAATKNSTGGKVSYLNLQEMLTFSWEVALGDITMTREEFLKLAAHADGIVWFKDRYLMLNPEEVKNIMERLSKPLPNLSAPELLLATLTGESQGIIFNPDHVLKKITEDLTRLEQVTLPKDLHAALRPYQERGFQWLYSNTVKGLGSCLADDMGLGKTVQVIALILKLKEENKLTGPSLIVCPTTLVGNWVKECAKFAPVLNVSVYHGLERTLNLKNTDLIVTSYGVLRQDVAKFKRKNWDLMVIDEAQNIKNPDSDQTKAAKSLKAAAKIAMSGTPVENRLMELWSIFDYANPGYFGSRQDFVRRFALPIEKYRSQEKITTLKTAAAPFILRRLKSDKTIIQDLPDKLIRNEYCYLSKEQTTLYQQVVDTMMQEISGSEGIARKGLVFKLMTSLKQICNHPAHYTGKGNILKEHSGKADKTIALLKQMLSSREKVLLFTQYREMGELLQQLIKQELQEEASFFHGGLTRKKRDEIVECFQSGQVSPILIVSLKAGGTGLNLTAATNVIHYDLWWNPAVEAQATDRTYRIGQTKNVQVHRLITLGTFEEKIDEMITAKKELADLTVSAGEQSLSELSNEELREIFSLVYS